MKLFFVIIVFIYSKLVLSDEALKTKNEITAKNPTLLAGVTLSQYRYSEPGFISHAGVLIGAWMHFNYSLLNQLEAELRTDLFSGHLDYDGALCDINTNQCTAYQAKTNVLILNIVQRFIFHITDELSVFLGLGDKYLYDRGESAAFYRRLGNYLYVPLGMTYQNKLEDQESQFVFDAEYDFFLNGQIESKLSDLGSKYSDINHRQNQGRAYKFSIAYEKLNSSLTRPWKLEIFYEKWSIDQSEQVELLIDGQKSGRFFTEPQNYSENVGLKLGWIYNPDL